MIIDFSKPGNRMERLFILFKLLKALEVALNQAKKLESVMEAWFFGDILDFKQKSFLENRKTKQNFNNKVFLNGLAIPLGLEQLELSR